MKRTVKRHTNAVECKCQASFCHKLGDWQDKSVDNLANFFALSKQSEKQVKAA